jgi:pimeloyl-ACP methyl ester carboxylesterase
LRCILFGVPQLLCCEAGCPTLLSRDDEGRVDDIRPRATCTVGENAEQITKADRALEELRSGRIFGAGSEIQCSKTKLSCPCNIIVPPYGRLTVGGLPRMPTEASAVRSIDVTSGEAIIEVKIAGVGPAVVMLAGYARGVSDFAELMHTLAAAGYQAIAINMRGAEGSSGPFDQLTFDMMADDIEEVARALGLGRFHILGHAYGGHLARYFAACHPEVIRTVIALPASGRQVVPVDPTRLAEAVTRTLAGTISANEMDRLTVECGLVAPGNSTRRFRTGWWPNAPVLFKALSQRRLNDYTTAGGKPLLVLYGAEDGFAPIPNVLSLKDELGDQVRLVEIIGAGHCAFMERPREVEAAILSWLSDHQNA